MPIQFNLAQHLAGQRAEVTVLAADEYELIHLSRQFKLKLLFKRSRPKAFLRRLRRKPVEAREPRGQSKGQVSERRERQGLLGASTSGQLRAVLIRWVLCRVGAGLLLLRPDVWPNASR